MSEGKEKEEKDAEELKEILGVVSKEVPALIRSIIGSVFSEEAGKDMGKAAAAFYKELKQGGMPEDTAVKMTENYMSVFTSLGDVMRRAVSGKGEFKGEEIGEEISKKIKEKMAEKQKDKEEDED